MSDSARLPRLIQQMLQPAFYPHSVQQPIRLIQTHISYVVLTGDYAYKLKKPVNFGFLDFTTLDRRLQFCRAELEMNRRAAALLYLDVLPIYEHSHGHYQLEQPQADSQPIEYTLKMREFPQDCLLLNLFQQGKLSIDLMQQLGETVAAFHRTAVTSDYIQQFGQPDRIKQAIDENYDRTLPYVGGPQSLAQYQATRQWTDRFFADHADLFHRRIPTQIRECHGDLHLRNICYWQNQLLLFDCIEFNEAFRFVDVMYDVAFTVMDLESRQRSDLANAFLNSYLEQTGDWQGVALLPLYLTRQAYVRAKVTSFLLDDPTVEATEKLQAGQAAADYYRLAWQYTQARSGRLILMCGLSGSGKSTVARFLALHYRAIQIRSDAVRKHLAGVALHDRGGPDLYQPEMTRRTYDRLLALGLDLAHRGFTVILDARYDQQQQRQSAILAAQQQQIPLQILHCTAPLAVVRERLQRRSADISDATVEIFAQQQIEPFTPEEQSYVKTFDTTEPLTQALGITER